MTVSFDEQWMVRYLDVNVDFQAVYKYKAERDVGGRTTHTGTRSMSCRSSTRLPTISVPKNAVDPPPMTRPARTGGAVMATKEEEPRRVEVHRLPRRRDRVDHVISMASKTEMGQRISGNREDRRIETHPVDTAIRVLRSEAARDTIGSIYNSEGAVVDLTTTSDMSIDRESASVTSDIVIERTATEVAPGVNAIPFDALERQVHGDPDEAVPIRIPVEAGEPWTRSHRRAVLLRHRARRSLHPDDRRHHGIRTPANCRSKPVACRRAVGVQAAVGRHSDRVRRRDGIIRVRARHGHVHASRTDPRRPNGIEAPPDTVVTLTLAFDDVGLLRFARRRDPERRGHDPRPTSAATGRSGAYHYTLEVTEISGEPIQIDCRPTVVDEPRPSRHRDLNVRRASRRRLRAGAGCGTRTRRRCACRSRRRSSRRCSSSCAARGSASTRGGPSGASP